MTERSHIKPAIASLEPGANADLFTQLVQAVRDYAIFLLTPEGNIASWNTGAALIKGYKAEEILGRHFSVFYTEDAIERQWPQSELQIAVREGRYEEEGWRVRKDGSQFWANVLITALMDSDGRLLGFAKITRDLTQRMEAEQRLRDSEERFRLLVSNVSDYAIFMLDPTGHVASWNMGAERLKGYTAQEAIGLHMSAFYPREANERNWPERELRAAREHGRFEDEGWRVRKDGTQFWANVLITAVYNEEGVLRGFAKITRDLTERDRVRALERSEKHTDQFLAMLGHELRNPLGSIRNAAYIVEQVGKTPALTRASEILSRQLDHLTHMVNDLLDVSRIRSGKIELRRERVELREVLRRAVEAAEPLITARRHTLAMPSNDAGLFLHGDLGRLVQIFTNLLNNAAKYTHEGGRIAVGVTNDRSTAFVSVRDTGIGIPDHMIARVFDVFVQGERSFDRAEGGLGLGLSLARTLAQLHGGSIEARSEGPGQGSEFLVRLPLLPRATADEEANARDSGAAASTRQILVVDDLRDSADSLAMNLKLAGYTVDVCYTGTEAVRQFEAHHHDVALLDIGLPDLSGYEVCKQVRSQPAHARPLVIAITGYGQQHDRERSLEAGFDYHLVKPVDLQVLLATIRSREMAGDSG